MEGSPNVFVGEFSDRGGGHAPEDTARTARAIGNPTSLNTATESPTDQAAADRPTGELPAESAPAAAERTELPPSSPVTSEPDWLEIELLGEDGRGLAGERYTVALPGGLSRIGYLDSDGRAMLYGIRPSTCEVGFPDLDAESWEPADG